MIIEVNFGSGLVYYAGLESCPREARCLFTVHRNEAHDFGATWAAEEAVEWIMTSTDPLPQTVHIVPTHVTEVPEPFAHPSRGTPL